MHRDLKFLRCHNLSYLCVVALVAQFVEHSPRKQSVVGSNPTQCRSSSFERVVLGVVAFYLAICASC